jgi:hypothetical protein
MLKEVVNFISAFQILPRHVSANGCHLQGAVVASYATQVMYVLWAYTDYDSFCVTVTAGTEHPVYTWIHPTTTGHTERVIIRIRPQHRHYLSSL